MTQTREDRENERRWERVLLVVTAFCVFVLLILCVALQIQVASRNRDIRKVERVVQEAKTASEQSKKAVDDALAAAKTESEGPGGSQAVLDALRTIQTIENQMQVLLGRPN